MTSTLDIYTQHFELFERPFSLVPDPSFLFWSPQHERAFATLEYGLLTRSPITVITGEVGAGKTTLLQQLLNSATPDIKIGLVANASGGRGDLLRWVMMSLSVPTDPQATYVDLFAAFQAHLIDQYSQNKRVVMVFDEAQNLDIESLEELRMFTNINTNKDELLQLVLVGQPELRDTINRPELRQFAQRVAATYHLPAMDVNVVRGYIAHRLKVAGAKRTIFQSPAIDMIHENTGGVPRLVNQLCDLCMVYAYSKDTHTVGRHTVQQVLDDDVFFAGGRPKKMSFQVLSGSYVKAEK